MNYPQLQNSTNPPRAFNCDALEGNWYEDRCMTDYDKRKKKNYLLPSPNAWQYDTTYGSVGKKSSNLPKLQERFSDCNDNYINFQDKDNRIYVTTTKHSMDPKYKETFKLPVNNKDYYKAKPEELQDYRNTWTRKTQLFDTTYKTDILSKTATSMIFNK